SSRTARQHISQKLQSPSLAMFRARRERLLLVKIHQERRALKRIETNIDKYFLMDKCRHVRAPTLSPIAHGRNIYAVQIGVPVVSLPRLSDKLAPKFKK